MWQIRQVLWYEKLSQSSLNRIDEHFETNVIGQPEILNNNFIKWIHTKPASPQQWKRVDYTNIYT